jgi:TRAP-type C4-dicarboxylate transport system permease small subunit
MKSIERLAALLFGFAFLFLAFAVAVETFLRKVFNISLQGVDELGGYVLAVGAGLSFAVALTSHAHIRIDIVHDNLPRALRVVLNITAVPALVACAVAVFAMAWLALKDTILFSATAQTPWATPLKYPQALWLVSLGVFVVVALAELFAIAILVLRGRFDEVDRRYGPRGAKQELDEELADLKARGVVAEATLPGQPAAAPNAGRTS